MINSVLLTRPYSAYKKEFPLGLLYVGTALKQKNYDVEIIDLHDSPKREDEIIDILSNSPTTILGISALSPHYRWVKNFTLELKKKSPQTLIVIGGHITTAYEILLQKTGVDYVCLGEGEETLSDLIKTLNEGRSPDEVSGIAYKKNSTVVKTSFRPLLKNFIQPDYELIDTERYLVHPSEDLFFNESTEYKKREKKDDKLSVIMFSRGCIGSCGFCYRHLPGFRQPSVEWAWNNLMALYEKFGVKYFRVDDELFMNDMDWFRAFYKKVIDSKIDIMFRLTGLRVDLVNDEQLSMLKKIGCIAINYGIESGSQKILDKMNKRTTVSQNIAAIKATLKHGMQAMAYIILGYEGENEKTLEETLSMLLEFKIPNNHIPIFYAVPLPGTKLYQDCLKNGKIKNEEDYLEKLALNIETRQELRKDYIINLSDVDVYKLVKWEKSLSLLVGLNRRFGGGSFIFKVARKIISFIPASEIGILILTNFNKLAFLAGRMFKKLILKKQNG